MRRTSRWPPAEVHCRRRPASRAWPTPTRRVRYARPTLPCAAPCRPATAASTGTSTAASDRRRTRAAAPTAKRARARSRALALFDVAVCAPFSIERCGATCRPAGHPVVCALSLGACRMRSASGRCTVGVGLERQGAVSADAVRPCRGGCPCPRRAAARLVSRPWGTCRSVWWLPAPGEDWAGAGQPWKTYGRGSGRTL